MAIVKTVEPYEFLVRWRDGEIAAYHFKTLTTIVDDGVVIHQKEGDAMNAQTAQEAGYDLSGIMEAVNVGNLQALSNAINEKNAALAEKAAAITARDQAEARAAAAEAALAERG